MVFTQESIAFQILDVFYLDQCNSKNRNSGRDFDALSFRLESVTLIETKHAKHHLRDGSIGYFPSSVSYQRTSEKDRLIVVHLKPLNFQGTEVECFHPDDIEKYRTLFTSLLNCWNQKETAYRYECSMLLNCIFAELYRDNVQGEPPYGKIEASVRYIEQNCLKEDFSISAAAECSFMSEVYFRKLFRERFGVSPKQYVLRYRIGHAASLILSGYFTLQEISEKCGFRDYKHFTVQFKKHLGVSPSRYGYREWQK